LAEAVLPWPETPGEQPSFANEVSYAPPDALGLYAVFGVFFRPTNGLGAFFVPPRSTRNIVLISSFGSRTQVFCPLVMGSRFSVSSSHQEACDQKLAFPSSIDFSPFFRSLFLSLD